MISVIEHALETKFLFYKEIINTEESEDGILTKQRQELDELLTKNNPLPIKNINYFPSMENRHSKEYIICLDVRYMKYSDYMDKIKSHFINCLESFEIDKCNISIEMELYIVYSMYYTFKIRLYLDKLEMSTSEFLEKINELKIDLLKNEITKPI